MNLRYSSSNAGPLGRIATLVAGGVLVVLGFMFSLVLLAVVAVLGLAAWGYFWWKTRGLRRAMGRRPPEGGQVIDGEAVVVEEERTRLPEEKRD